VSAEPITPEVEAILDRALSGDELDASEGASLCRARGDDVVAIAACADELRSRQAGELVTYVVNRNINFTNVCIKHCTFCAFSREHREEQGYFLPTEEIVRRAREAWDLGATEVCIQAGLAPKLDGWYYVDLVRLLKKELPGLHLHAFSPEEVLYGATRANVPVRKYLEALRDAGHDTLPGTSAEILNDEVRDVISKGRISTDQWIDVVTTAHELGIRTTSTIMYGHVETYDHWAEHMTKLRAIQKNTGGFTEFVPLSFIHQEAPMVRKNLVKDARRGATSEEVVKMHAVARLLLGATFRNIQASWVKEGPEMARHLLACGANDLGGTLINESISTSAGASHGQLLSPVELRRLIRAAGRVPAERTSVYAIRKVFEGEGDEAESPLDRIHDREARFGSYEKLAQSAEFRFRMPDKERSLS
jgi:7,8-didemethyl-8-hydroxy-5-deazariboflavin synthase CofH subunit